MFRESLRSPGISAKLLVATERMFPLNRPDQGPAKMSAVADKFGKSHFLDRLICILNGSIETSLKYV